MKKFFTTLFLIIATVLPFSAQDLYDINSITVIELTFQESNWDALLDSYYAAGNDERLLASAVINGEPFDSVGVKYKGNSTYSSNNSKNPLNISLDYMINQNYQGFETLKLSNGKKDPSFVREVLSYEIARKYMKAPLSNYAKVYVNGNYYGMFSSSEAINKDFMDSKMDVDTDNTRVKCNPEDTNNGGSSLEYLGADSSLYYNYYEVKSDAGWQDLLDFTYALKYNTSEIENSLDVDHAIWMLAFDNVMVNLDSYIGPFRQNYYLIKDDNARFVPVIWDLNESFGAFAMINSGGNRPVARFGPPGNSTSTSLDELDLFLREDDSTYPLLQVIYNNDRYRKMYVAHCKTMLEENFANGWYTEKADTLQDLIATDLAADPNAFYSSSQFRNNINSSQDGVIGIVELMDSRVSYLQGLEVFNYSAPSISEVEIPEAPAPFTSVSITATIQDANYAHVAYRHSKDEAFIKVQMYDDGAHEDGAAGDGVYGASFEVDESNTHFYIYAENDDAGMFSPQRAEKEYYKITAEASVALDDVVVINEIMASNDNVATDEMGEYDDWVELYNNSDQEVSLKGYYLSDDDEDIVQWAFPDTVIKANDYLIVWTDKDAEQGAMHANFKLSASGEGVYLINPDLEVINISEFEEQTSDVAYARNPNGVGDFNLQWPTFSYNNDETSGAAALADQRVAFTCYPNPVSDVLNVQTAGQMKSVHVYDALGQCVIVESSSFGELQSIDMSRLEQGLYVVIVKTANEYQRCTVLKQ